MRLDPLRAIDRQEGQCAVDRPPAAWRAGEAAWVGPQVAAPVVPATFNAAIEMIVRPPLGSRIRPCDVNGPSFEPPLAR